MATYFIDFDGTFFQYGTMEPVEGAVAFVKGLKSRGHAVVFVTARRQEENIPKALGIEETKKVLKALNIPCEAIVSDVGSPRVLGSVFKR